MKNKKIEHVIVLGFALFAMFFGAGNLILPPFIGLTTSSEWFWAMLGFGLTGVIGPFLGILAVVQSGEGFTDLGKRVNGVFAVVLGIVIMLTIGPLIAIPRTGATTYEIGILPIFPSVTPNIGSLIFFAITLALSISRSKIVDIIGKFLTPALIVLLFILVIMGILNPPNLDLVPTLTKIEAFSNGFEEGYQTLDVLASVIFAGIIISAAKAKGYTTIAQRSSVSMYAGIIAVIFLFFIYGGLLYLGATSGYPLTDKVVRTELLLSISKQIMGDYGTYAISLSIALACLTTAIALTCAIGSFFESISKGLIPYKVGVVLSCIVSGFLAVNSVDSIISYAIPLLMFVYPITFAMVIYIVFFGKKVHGKAPYVLAVAFTAIVSFLSIPAYFKIDIEAFDTVKNYLPGSAHNLEWLLPSLIGFILGILYNKLLSKDNKVVLGDE